MIGFWVLDWIPYWNLDSSLDSTLYSTPDATLGSIKTIRYTRCAPRRAMGARLSRCPGFFMVWQMWPPRH
eukprot:7126164-Lingulodinium_polyedra.AAC.1